MGAEVLYMQRSSLALFFLPFVMSGLSELWRHGIFILIWNKTAGLEASCFKTPALIFSSIYISSWIYWEWNCLINDIESTRMVNAMINGMIYFKMSSQLLVSDFQVLLHWFKVKSGIFAMKF